MAWHLEIIICQLAVVISWKSPFQETFERYSFCKQIAYLLLRNKNVRIPSQMLCWQDPTFQAPSIVYLILVLWPMPPFDPWHCSVWKEMALIRLWLHIWNFITRLFWYKNVCVVAYSWGHQGHFLRWLTTWHTGSVTGCGHTVSQDVGIMYTI